MDSIIVNCFVAGFGLSAVVFFTGYIVRLLNILLHR